MTAEVFSHVAENLLRLRERMAAALLRAGRREDAARLVAVSKNFPAAAVLAAFTAGQKRFGENRVQELAAKAPGLPPEIEWHLIGHLQGNKAGKAVEHADCVEAVDSIHLLKRLDRLAGEAGKRVPVLLEVNVSGEESKFGLRGERAVRDAVEAAVGCSNLDLRGLMTMAPYGVPEAEARRIFAGLRELRDRMAGELLVALPELSMGMSADYEAAIAEGATLVRVGTAIFGERS